MQCLILAGGLGTRIASVSNGQPKALLPVGPKSFLEWQLRWLHRLGVTNVVLALGSGAEAISACLETLKGDAGLPLCEISLDGATLLGTGGAVRRALPLLEENFLVTYGDSFLRLPVTALFERHLKAGKGLTLSIFRNLNQHDRSNVLVHDGRFVRYDKFRPDPAMEYIDYGMSAVRREDFARFRAPEKFDYADFITACVADGNASSFEAFLPFLEVGSVEGWSRFVEFIRDCRFDLDEVAKTMKIPEAPQC